MKQVVVWFDGSCPLCRREIEFMRRLDKAEAIEFVDVIASEADCPLDKGLLLARFHAQEGEHLYSGAAAFAAMWRAIPVLRPIGVAAKNTYVLAALEWLYVAFLRIRPSLQKLASRFE